MVLGYNNGETTMARTPTIPTMMVLYANDSVEVRYSDDSRLHLSPCGSSMLHQDPSSHRSSHPLAGGCGVGKWTQFVTSAHKNKVLQALDFRNRFAERPFLCPTLLPPHDIVSLYTKIDRVAWAKRAEESHIEVFGDGSRRSVSADEYASLVLSPHGQDFTVCYLSAVSQDSPQHSLCHSDRALNLSAGDDMGHNSNHNSSLEGPRELSAGDGMGHNSNSNHNSSLEGTKELSAVGAGESRAHNAVDVRGYSVINTGHTKGGNSQDAGELSAISAVDSRDHNSVDTRERSVNTGNTKGRNSKEIRDDDAVNTGGDGNTARADRGTSSPAPAEATLEASGLILSDGTFSTPGRSMQCDPHASTVTSVQHDLSCISRVSTPDGLRGMVECDVTLTLGDEATPRPPVASTDILHSSPRTETCQPPVSSTTDILHSSPRGQTCQPLVSATAEFLHSSKTSQPPVSSTNLLHNTSHSQPVATVVPAHKENTPGPHSDTDRGVQSEGAFTATGNAAVSHGYLTQRTDTTTRGVRGEARCVNTSHATRERSSQVTDHTGGGQQIGGGGRGCGGSVRRHHYTWVTQHISCSDCPAAWRHPLTLLQRTDPTDCVLVSECHLTVSTKLAKARGGGGGQSSLAADRDRCVFSSVTPPLPLTCPLQHQHLWPPDHRDDEEGRGQEDISEFKQGQLKVLMMEGVVYRFVDVANMKRVEIYPGDGSVMVSQGVTAHFFSHLMWANNKLQEKTYSVKTLPPMQHTAMYSVKNLIQRGHRLLTGCVHYRELSDRKDVPCWKHAPMQVVQPLTPAVLEEVAVPGCGRFSAFSNGRVRVVFTDRTSLDMVADFSQRVYHCLQHSLDSQSCTDKMMAPTVSNADDELKRQHCRLLLPNGKYVTVDTHAPGIYRRYTDAGKEWIRWVQSSPKDRRQFYQQKARHSTAHLSAEAELKKIECFNYIVDHTSAVSSSSPPQHTASVVPVSGIPALGVSAINTHRPANNIGMPVKTSMAAGYTFMPDTNTYMPDTNTYMPGLPVNISRSTTTTGTSSINTFMPAGNTHMPVNNTHVPAGNTYMPGSNTHMPGSNTHMPGSNTHMPVTNTHMPVNSTSRPETNTLMPAGYTHMPVTNTHMPVNSTSMPGSKVYPSRTSDPKVYLPKGNYLSRPRDGASLSDPKVYLSRNPDQSSTSDPKVYLPKGNYLSSPRDGASLSDPKVYLSRNPDLSRSPELSSTLGSVSSVSDPRGQEMAQGFQSVREALLRTSQMIHDIDHLVQQTKTSSTL